jgi:hypothetical protein|tara:strand:+ start:1481 stop:1666 length:186 start_codon:yes stop_codon:yes gene_type:complete
LAAEHAMLMMPSESDFVSVSSLFREEQEKTFINNLKIAVVRKPNEVYDAVPVTTNCKRINP